jgi:hypothetical protein
MAEPLTGTIVPASASLPAIPDVPPDPRPCVAYLARLKSRESRRVMRPCLDWIAVRIGRENALDVPWHALRYEHTSVIHAMIMEPATGTSTCPGCAA